MPSTINTRRNNNKTTLKTIKEYCYGLLGNALSTCRRKSKNTTVKKRSASPAYGTPGYSRYTRRTVSPAKR